MPNGGGGIFLFHCRRAHHAARLLSCRLEGSVSSTIRAPGGVVDRCRPSRLVWRSPMKIGFLALSGLRAHDPKLLALGLTLPGVIERGNVIARLPSLGLLYLAAVTPPGHELHYYEAEADGAEPPEVYECDLVAISTFSAQVFEAYAIADRLRA